MANPVWRLPSHVHAAASGQDLVLLDVRRDAYFCLPDRGEARRAGSDDAALGPLGAELAAELQAAGLLAAGPGEPRRTRVAAAAQADLFDRDLPRPSPRERRDLVRALVVLAFAYRGRSLEQLLARAGARAERLGSGDVLSADHVRRSLVFRALLPWSPVQGECLFQAALLLEFLGQVGLAADWVFGVRTWPFRAHCWLQVGETVLNDTVDRVAPFAAILVA